MDNFNQLIAFGIGSICLGVTLALAGLFALARRHSGQDGGEGCLGFVLCASGLALAGFFFFAALTG